MPRHRALNLQKFIESVPDSLLQEYFEWKFEKKVGEILKSFDFDSVNDFLDSMSDNELRDSITEDFTHINDVCEKQMNCLVRAIHLNNIMTSGHEEQHELAMGIFLHHLGVFDYAYDMYCFYNTSSKMSQFPLQCDNFKLTLEKLENFKSRISTFYAEQEKGQDCIVRHYDEGDTAVIVVIHGSYKRSVMTLEGQEIRTVFFRPANEDVIQFEKGSSVLSIKAGLKKDKDNYIKVFQETILNELSPADRGPSFTLEPIQTGTFRFNGNEQIKGISLTEIKLELGGLSNPTIVVSSSNVINSLELDVDGIKLNSGKLISARFCFEVKLDKKKPKKVTFEITPPYITDLNKKKYAELIGAYLKENGVKLV